MDLIRYSDPTGHGGFICPSPPAISPTSNTWSLGLCIITPAARMAAEIFAHDFFVQSQFPSGWSAYYDLSKKSRNEDVRIFGRPVRAMADGEVFGLRPGVRGQ